MQRRRIAVGILTLSVLLSGQAAPDIFRWDNGQLIPGTAGITPAPEVQLARMDLQYAELSGADLSGADLQQSSLSSANFAGANLKNAYMFAAYWLTPAMFWPCHQSNGHQLVLSAAVLVLVIEGGAWGIWASTTRDSPSIAPHSNPLARYFGLRATDRGTIAIRGSWRCRLDRRSVRPVCPSRPRGIVALPSSTSTSTSTSTSDGQVDSGWGPEQTVEREQRIASVLKSTVVGRRVNRIVRRADRVQPVDAVFCRF